MEINYSNIPEELKSPPQIVNWKKKDKIPVNPKTGGNAMCNKPATWGTYDQAKDRFESNKGNGIGGIGFVFSKDDDNCGIDIDHCIKDGVIDPDVDAILKELNTYCEISPSGDGIHAIAKGKLPGDGLGPKEGRLCEMYDRDRYFTLTGRWLSQYGGRIENRQTEVTSLYNRMSGENSTGRKTNVIELKAGVSQGSRNASCTSVAGHHLGEGHSVKETIDYCLGWNLKNTPPLPEKEIIKTVKSIARKDAQHQKQIVQMLTECGLNHDKVIECLYRNEDGDAHLFQRLYTDKFIFDHGANLWAEWLGHCWRDDETENAYKRLESVVELYRAALSVERKSEKRLEVEIKKTLDPIAAAELIAKHKVRKAIKKELRGRIRGLESASRKRNVLWLAGIGTGLTGREWDKNPWLLGCNNGVVDLKTGKLRAGKQTDYIKTATEIDFDASADCPKWKQFVKEVFDHDEDLINYVKRLFGYGITGLKEEHVLPVLHGTGRNGKGTFVETNKKVMGPLAHKTKAESLLDNGRLKASGTADADVIAFMGKRLVWASETSEGGRMNVGKIKELVGGDTLNARAPYARRPVEFEPTHLLCLITNAKPYANASDYAIWERLRLIPFTLSFVDEPKEEHERQVNKKLPEELGKELPGILNWLVEGCLEWQILGLTPPDIVKAATKSYQKENDLIGDFISECCEVGHDKEIKAGLLYGAYEIWCKSMGHKPLNGKRFAQEVIIRFEKESRRNRSFYIGLSLIEENVENSDHYNF